MTLTFACLQTVSCSLIEQASFETNQSILLEVAIYSSRLNITPFGRVYTAINLAGDRSKALI